ncbi:MAG: CDP-alcohol phosphatidyltransferase family protein, partial [Alphaproteobacteria bacterium]
PNQVTMATILLSLAAGAVILLRPDAVWPLFLVPAVLAVRVVFNHVDGMLACEHGMKTPLGALLNELADAVSDAALYLPLAALPGMPAWLVVAAVVLGLISEMSGVAALRIGAGRREDGPLGKKPRGLVFAGAALALAFGVASEGLLSAVFGVAIILLLLTIANRVNSALKQAARPCSPA